MEQEDLEEVEEAEDVGYDSDLFREEYGSGEGEDEDYGSP